MKASFVVIAYNEERHIEPTIRSIAQQSGLPSDYEIVVIDDASTDRTAKIVTACAAELVAVRLVTLDRNSGRGAARARGVAEARGEVIATIDSDIVLPPEWYQRCCEALESADAVGGIAVPDGDVCYLYNRFRLNPRPVMHAAELTGNNALYRRSVFAQVGFDPALRNGEDVALGHAMREVGVVSRTVDDLYVRHEEAKSFKKSLAWLFESGVGASHQLRRFGEIRQPDLVFAGWAILLLCGAVLFRRGQRVPAVGLPLAYLGMASTAHVRSRFFIDRALGRFSGAVVADTVLLGAYLAGRVVGMVRPLPT